MNKTRPFLMFVHLCKTVNEITNLVRSHGTLRKEKPVQRRSKNHLNYSICREYVFLGCILCTFFLSIGHQRDTWYLYQRDTWYLYQRDTWYLYQRDTWSLYQRDTWYLYKLRYNSTY